MSPHHMPRPEVSAEQQHVSIVTGIAGLVMFGVMMFILSLQQTVGEETITYSTLKEDSLVHMPGIFPTSVAVVAVGVKKAAGFKSFSMEIGNMPICRHAQTEG